jgi:uncharacterized protein YbjT (DUF2867 family)
VEERTTVRCLLAALQGSGLEKIVAQSTYGARPAESCGDLSVLYELEEGLRTQPIPTAIMRAAYLMSNWDAVIPSAKQSGVLPSMLPSDLRIPMVAPKDLGAVAARLLLEPPNAMRIHYAEGPERYTPQDVAAACARALARTVEVAVTPPKHLEEAFHSLGFSEAAARSYARMTRVTIDDVELPATPIRGSITISDYVSAAASMK